MPEKDRRKAALLFLLFRVGLRYKRKTSGQVALKQYRIAMIKNIV